uniref:G-protein coupled receptors family 1 profile domain-containing protein n=1 Tax=Latimeria chalumnae TaxID=7897 RepID=H3AX25_LATCH
LAANLFTVYMICFRNCGMSKTACIYLAALAILDTLCLFWGALLDLSLYWLQEYPFWNKPPWCGLLTVMEYGSMFSSIWIVVIFTMERYLVLRSTHARHHCSQLKTTLRITLSVILVSHLIAVPAYWIHLSVKANFTIASQTKELPSCTYNDDIYSTVIVWIHTFIQGGIPFVLIIIFNSLIGHQLYKASSLFTKDQRKTITGITTRSHITKTILILFTVSITFVVLTLPRFVTYCILRTLFNTPMHKRDDYGKLINVFADVAIMMQYLNSAINFILYCVVSKRFRQESWALLTCTQN